MKYALIVVVLLSGPAYAGSGFALGGAAGYREPEPTYQPLDLDRQFEADRQRRLLQENNRILREQQDRQTDRDINRIFRQYGR